MALFRQHSNYPLTHLSPSLVGDSLKARDPVGFVSLVYKPLIAPQYKPPPGNLCIEYLFSAVSVLGFRDANIISNRSSKMNNISWGQGNKTKPGKL